MVHWICPFYKKKSVFDTGNYRGVHLAAQMSKAVERLLMAMFVPRLVSISAYGENQFVYLPARGAHDTLAFLVLTWIVVLGRSSSSCTVQTCLGRSRK